MTEYRDLHDRIIRVGAKAKLSGGYHDSARPVYLAHELVEVQGFARTRVTVRLLNRDYAERPLLRVLPRTLVLEPDDEEDTEYHLTGTGDSTGVSWQMNSPPYTVV